MYRFLFSIEVQRCVQIIQVCSSVSTINRYANFTSVCKLITKIFTLLCFQYKAHTNRSFTIKIRLLINDVLLAFARRHKPFKRFAHDVQHVATLELFFFSFIFCCLPIHIQLLHHYNFTSIGTTTKTSDYSLFQAISERVGPIGLKRRVQIRQA